MAYFRAFCKVSIIVRSLAESSVLLYGNISTFGSGWRKMSSRRIAVGFIGCGLDVRGCGTRIVVRADHSLSHSTLRGRLGSGIDRSDVNAMNPIEKNVKSLEDYIKLTKASRYHFCLDSEDYTGFLKILVNAKLRNAIGHNDVEYNSVD